MKIAFVTPALNMAETPLQYHRPLIPMGPALLAALVEDAVTEGRWSAYVSGRLRGEKRGYEASGQVIVIDNLRDAFYGEYSERNVISRLDAFFGNHPQDECFIGMTVLSDGMRSARRLLGRFREEWPNVQIMVGGPHATFFPYDFYQDPRRRRGPLADYVIRNEGENVLLPLLRGELREWRQVVERGVELGVDVTQSDYGDEAYRVLDGGQFGGGSAQAAQLHVLDDLPPPAYFLFQDSEGTLRYEPDYRYDLRSPAANINSSRGCPHKCTFCTIPMLAPGYRTMSPERMVDLIRFLQAEYGVGSIFFREDNFLYGGGTVEGDRWADVHEFADRLRDANVGVRFAIEARADNLTVDTGGGRRRLDVLADAGLSGIYIGVESGTDRMLKLYGKGASVDQMSAALRGCEERSVRVVATAIYSDPDLLLKGQYENINPAEPKYYAEIVRERQGILEETRAFMNSHRIPNERREEYVLVGIPVSATYKVLERATQEHPQMVEWLDPITRYIYPKGFRWWSEAIYGEESGVRSYYGFQHSTGLASEQGAAAG